MDETQEMSNQDGLAEEVIDSLAGNGQSDDVAEGRAEEKGSGGSGDPLYVQKRLKQQKRAHEREMRAMQSRLQELESRTGHQYGDHTFDADSSYADGGIDQQIQKAVSYALQHKENEERKAKEREGQALVHRKYQDLHQHLDGMADRYDDFDDVVRGEHAAFTPTIRDAALLLPQTGPGSAGEVLYKLGKAPEELKRLSQLHPVEQAQELIRLSHGLISNHMSPAAGSDVKPMQGVKNNPAINTGGLNEKTSIGDLRKRMRNNWR